MDLKIEEFLENHNMDYLFLLLANLEVERLNNLPDFVKKKLKGKITENGLAHVAKNEVPDYIVDEESDS